MVIGYCLEYLVYWLLVIIYLMFNLSISPPQTEIIIKPGATFIQAYTVINNSSTPISVYTTVQPWLPADPNGAVSYNTKENPNFVFSLANSDFTLNQKFILAPQQKTQLLLKLKIDPNTPPGDAYYTFFINQSDQNDATARIGSHLLISASATENVPSSILIKNLTASPRFFKDILFSPINFSAEISNSTNFYTKSSGKIVITKGNLTIKELELEPVNILAHHSRTLQCKDYTPCVFSPPFWPGLYTATVKLNENLSHTSETISFFVFPYSITFFLFFMLILGLFLTKLSSKFRLFTP